MPTLNTTPPYPRTRQLIGPTLKCILINLDRLVMALPIERIDKIIKQATILSSGLSHLGVTQYGGDLITVVDLYHQLFQTRRPTLPNVQDSYLIIATTTTTDRFAFPIQAAPSLVEFSLSELRVLPPSYRRADTLGVASHVVRMAQPSAEESTVFILDMDYLAARCSGQTPLI